MTMGKARTIDRIRYGWRVLGFASGVLSARTRRVRPIVDTTARRGFNEMFHSSLPAAFEPERAELEQFDLYLYDVMNSRRLEGQIVFEYGTLLAATERWSDRRVLDIGTGRSTFPGWMSGKGAIVTSLDLATPAERLPGGFQERVNGIVARPRGAIRQVAGSMRCLPFADNSFDLVTSLSVLEHLDTNLPERTFVPYEEQKRRLAETLDEMIRIATPGGVIYITSECCDFDRATADAWKPAYYYDEGPELSGAWPVRDVAPLFYDYLAARGCTLVGGVQFEASNIGRPEYWSWRGPYFSGFSLLARKP
jgi:SAM-dependent methyltransferase